MVAALVAGVLLVLLGGLEHGLRRRCRVNEAFFFFWVWVRVDGELWFRGVERFWSRLCRVGEVCLIGGRRMMLMVEEKLRASETRKLGSGKLPVVIGVATLGQKKRLHQKHPHFPSQQISPQSHSQPIQQRETACMDVSVGQILHPR